MNKKKRSENKSFILLFLSCILLTTTSTFAQTKKYNQVSIELSSGAQIPLLAKNISRAEYSSLQQFQLSGRYMFNPKFGMKGSFGFHGFENRKKSEKPKYNLYRYNIEAVFNLAQLFEIDYRIRERATILAHTGGGFTFVNELNTSEKTDYLNVNLGFTAQVKLSNHISIMGDLSVIKNFPTKTVEEEIEMYALVSIGLVFHLGDKRHAADWY